MRKLTSSDWINPGWLPDDETYWGQERVRAVQDGINKALSRRTPAERYYLGRDYLSIPQKFSIPSCSAPVETGRPRVKRRIYLIQDEDKVRVIALGFRTDDRKAIEEWATADNAALNLELDPAEVDVRWLAPGVVY